MVETERRRKIQMEYNEKNGIVPQTIKKDVRDVIEISTKEVSGKNGKKLTKNEKEKLIEALTREMNQAAKMLEFEHAAFLRDKINKLKG